MQRLELAAAPDLMCANIMCEKLGGPCMCRVSIALQKLPHLTHLDLSNNHLPQVPDAVSPQYLPKLASLNVSGNAIAELPAHLADFKGLQARPAVLSHRVDAALTCALRLALMWIKMRMQSMHRNGIEQH